MIPLSKRLGQILQAHPRTGELVWEGVGDFKKAWKSACQLAGVEGCR
jgi:hypothetical protein